VPPRSPKTEEWSSKPARPEQRGRNGVLPLFHSLLHSLYNPAAGVK